LQWVLSFVFEAAPHFDGSFDAETLRLAGHQPFDGADVALGKETVPSWTALRLGEAVAALPGAQGVRLEAGLLDDSFQVEGWNIS
jgi:hypothetical protein